MMNGTFRTVAVLGALALCGATGPTLAQSTVQRSTNTAQARPVQSRPSASSQLKAAAQGPGQAARVFDGGRVNTPTTVHVQPSTTTVNAAAIAARENAAERARQAAASRKWNLDNRPVPSTH